MSNIAGLQLAEWLRTRGWSVARLADELGLTRQRIYQLLEEENKPPSLETAVKLQRITGIPTTAWVSEEEGKTA